MNTEQILALRTQEDKTINEMLRSILTNLVVKGKRPGYDLSWQNLLLVPLIKAGVIKGEIVSEEGEDDEVEDVDWDDFAMVMTKLIASVFAQTALDRSVTAG